MPNSMSGLAITAPDTQNTDEGLAAIRASHAKLNEILSSIPNIDIEGMFKPYIQAVQNKPVSKPPGRLESFARAFGSNIGNQSVMQQIAQSKAEQDAKDEMLLSTKHQLLTAKLNHEIAKGQVDRALKTHETQTELNYKLDNLKSAREQREKMEQLDAREKALGAREGVVTQREIGIENLKAKHAGELADLKAKHSADLIRTKAEETVKSAGLTFNDRMELELNKELLRTVAAPIAEKIKNKQELSDQDVETVGTAMKAAVQNIKNRRLKEGETKIPPAKEIRKNVTTTSIVPPTNRRALLLAEANRIEAQKGKK